MEYDAGNNMGMGRKVEPRLTLEEAAEKFAFDVTLDDVRTSKTHCRRGHRAVSENRIPNGTTTTCGICEKMRRGRVIESEKIGFTHCPSGHLLSKSNLVRDHTGKQNVLRCKKCLADSKKNTVYGPGASEWFHERVASSGGTCNICSERGNLHLDHSHVDGSFRGVLCVGCNTFLGKLEKRMDILDKVLEYLGVEA